MAASLNNEDEEKLRRIEMDRLEINAAYDNGFSNDSIDDEKSSMESSTKSFANMNLSELQAKTDRYGFIHNEKLPTRLTEIEIKRNKIEKLRETKWLDMLKNWSSYNTSNSKFEKLKSRIYKGIPDSMRNIAWYKLLDVENQIKAQTGVYDRMKNLARKYSVDLRQIDLDINRTFRDNLAYKKRYCQRQVQLYNVLAAYSIYNTEIGYCQGMSNIAALLLMYLSDEERTFWALSQLMSNSKYSMHGFFKKGFPKLIRFSDKHDSIVKDLMPKLYKKFLKCDITALLYTTKWFLQIYLDALPFSLVLRIWDVFLLKGDIVLLGMSYCILKMHKKNLVKKNMDQINDYLKNQLTNNFGFEDDIVLKKLELSLDNLKRYKFGGLSKSPFEAIPTNELPTIPFGIFKSPINKQQQADILSLSKRTSSSGENRKEALEKMATVKLESEKKKQREERRQRRLNAQTANNKLTSDSIKNISDDDDDDEDDDDDDDDFNDDDDDDDDDLNPSRLSEYEDEKGDKGSIISDLTHQTSSHRSSTDLQSQNSLENKLAKSKNSKSKRSINSNNSYNQTAKSEYDNHNGHDMDADSMSRYQMRDPVKLVAKGTRDSQTARVKASNGSGRFDKITAKPLGACKEAYKATSGTFDVTTNVSALNRSTTSIGFSPTARVMSNPPPLSPTMCAQSVVAAKNFATGYEYQRTPHGVYTRLQQAKPTSLMQHSTSNMQIAPLASTSAMRHMPIVSTKRTSSLRTMQKHMSHHQLSMDQPSTSAFKRNNTPTKLQLHNHAMRIASIQQQQQQQQQEQQQQHHQLKNSSSSNFSSISVIAQAPKQAFPQSMSPECVRNSSIATATVDTNISSPTTVLTQYKLLNSVDLLPTPPSSTGDLNGKKTHGGSRLMASTIGHNDIEQFDYI